MSKKIIIALSAVAVLLIGSGGFYFFLNNEEEIKIENTETEELEKDIFNNIYMYRAEKRDDSFFRDADVQVSDFKAGDFVGVGGNYSTEESKNIKLDIVDSNGLVFKKNVLEVIIRREEDGNFDVCCSEVPDEAGGYQLNFKSDSKLIGNIPFSVVE